MGSSRCALAKGVPSRVLRSVSRHHTSAPYVPPLLCNRFTALTPRAPSPGREKHTLCQQAVQPQRGHSQGWQGLSRSHRLHLAASPRQLHHGTMPMDDQAPDKCKQA